MQTLFEFVHCFNRPNAVVRFNTIQTATQCVARLLWEILRQKSNILFRHFSHSAVINVKHLLQNRNHQTSFRIFQMNANQIDYLHRNLKNFNNFGTMPLFIVHSRAQSPNFKEFIWYWCLCQRRIVLIVELPVKHGFFLLVFRENYLKLVFSIDFPQKTNLYILQAAHESSDLVGMFI